ncbi:ABC transporter ATP-binding protein [Brachybacterium sp. ACRRE]|uniref:ABC transporter ATP-binding protein n=1 Tax=Brachybacterium sp. ACRRE TaxID=2918184 RepID=UPI001EF358C7|nr:ABC transporter ATP-binding protein [Brachybacterium sp. ACRRE]MCG7308144.1 ABC transporter ATP-binding protein [Brachybacterium sp. ACRRE]
MNAGNTGTTSVAELDGLPPSSVASGAGAASSRLSARGASIGYGERTVIETLDVQIPDDSFTVIIGPNACGKSTLLRSMSRLLKPSTGHIVLDGKDIRSLSPRAVATRLGLLPQSSIAPDGIRVADLVARGRFPHRGAFSRNTPEDRAAVAAALSATNTRDLATRLVDELSGGQRQRAWIAMVLAQQTDLLLLDEPTTYLDIAHQIGVLELCARLNAQGRTVVAVLHDLNHACRFATHIIAMRDGRIVAEGPPQEVITPRLVEEVFDLPSVVIEDPTTGRPLVVPRPSTS